VNWKINMHQIKKMGVLVVLASLFAANLMAQSIVSPSLGDVLLCFRPAGGGAYDLVVDAGSVATLTNAPQNQRILITQYTGNQLADVGTNSTGWSAFTWFDDTPTLGIATNTLFTTISRNSLNRMASAPSAAPHDSQGIVVNDMSSVLIGAQITRSYSADSSDYAVIEPDDPNNNNTAYTSGQSYIGALGPDLDFGGDAEFQPENETSSGFTAAGVVVRSDFFQIPPTGQGSVKYLGYFEFNTNGAMTYVAYPTAPTVATVAASAIASSGAQLNSTVGVINTNTDNTSVYFQYGLTTSYGSSTTVTNIGAASGSYALPISGLAASTQYYFRAVAYNQYGTNFGSALSFTTTGGGTPVVPVILSIHRTNNVATVTFTTGGFGTYSLLGTNSLASGTSKTNWPAISSAAGTGSPVSLSDTNNSTRMFYIISAQ
jgi:hypothetical protein